MFNVFPTARLRPSPFYQSAVAEGMTPTANVYNRMVMPTSFGDPLAEYWRLINGVSQWDVGVDRQVQLEGRMQAGWRVLSPRDLSGCKVGQGECALVQPSRHDHQ